MDGERFDDRPAALTVHVASDEGSVSAVVGDEAARDELIRFICDPVDAPQH
jgi:hypothetical protein